MIFPFSAQTKRGCKKPLFVYVKQPETTCNRYTAAGKEGTPVKTGAGTPGNEGWLVYASGGAGFGAAGAKGPAALRPGGGVPPPSAPPPASRQLPYLRAYVRLRGINCPNTRNGPRPHVERRIRFGSMIRSHTGRKPGCKLLSVMPPAAAESERFPPPFVQTHSGKCPPGCRF